MMGSTQKYSLKWNDFTVNVASTFRDLHSRHDFVDVTLACSDGSTLEAHKVILSSVSSYFRDILKVGKNEIPLFILFIKFDIVYLNFQCYTHTYNIGLNIKFLSLDKSV